MRRPSAATNFSQNSGTLDPAAHPVPISEQLERILASSLFNHSKRSSTLLEYVVTETLNGHAEGLKERTIGMAVFGRRPTYNTAEDPIVRGSAADVRKRLAQYYYDVGHECEIRIELTSGSYVPHFWLAASTGGRKPPAIAELAHEPLSEEPVLARAVPLESNKPRSPFRVQRLGITAGAQVLGLLTLWLSVRIIEVRSPIQRFWHPLLTADTVLLAMGDLSDTGMGSAPGSFPGLGFAQTAQNDKVGYVDGMALARVAALLGQNGKLVEIRRAGSVSLRDLRRGPAVLVGEMNNPWARLVESDLRFRFQWDEVGKRVQLVDNEHVEEPLWRINFDTKYDDLKEDRAIITRVLDPRTENSILILAGCGRDGTAAAAEFATQSKYLEKFAQMAPKGWEKKNFQLIIATDLIKGTSGPPRIVTIYCW